MKTMLFLYVGGSIFLTLISLPLIARKVKPNPFYGFRIQQTLDDPNVWYETNRYFAKRLFGVGIVQALASLGFYYVPNITLDAYALLCLGMFIILFSIALIQSWGFMKSIRK